MTEINEESVERHHCHCRLFKEICARKGNDVSLRALGGFIFQGTIMDVDNGLVSLSALQFSGLRIFMPGLDCMAGTCEAGAVTLNVNAITALGRPNPLAIHPNEEP